MPGRLFHIEDNWYEWRQQPPLDAQVTVRVEPRGDGRLGLAELRIVGEPTSQLMRTIPLGRIEATANAQLSAIDDRVLPHPRQRRRAPGRQASTTGSDDGWERPDPPPVTAHTARRAAGSPPRGRPDRFYADIAAAYSELAQTSRRPAAELAGRHDVPVTTAHRWIKEARRRGHLGPGRPGKTG